MDTLNKVTGINEQAANKLHTYKMFKDSFNVEAYIKMPMQKRYRKALAMFSAGIAPIGIELRRYGCNKLSFECRVCCACQEVIESERHVLTQCPL